MIKEVNKSDVLRSLVDGVKVFRINTKEMIVVDLDDRTMSVIKRDLKRDEYIYFILDEGRVHLSYADELSLEHKREYVNEFCHERLRCQDCPLNEFVEECYKGAPDDVIERNYQIIREYENEVK